MELARAFTKELKNSLLFPCLTGKWLEKGSQVAGSTANQFGFCRFLRNHRSNRPVTGGFRASPIPPNTENRRQQPESAYFSQRQVFLFDELYACTLSEVDMRYAIIDNSTLTAVQRILGEIGELSYWDGRQLFSIWNKMPMQFNYMD